MESMQNNGGTFFPYHEYYVYNSNMKVKGTSRIRYIIICYFHENVT